MPSNPVMRRAVLHPNRIARFAPTTASSGVTLIGTPSSRRNWKRSGKHAVSKLRLSLACWDYDRTRALADGSVPVDGIDLVYQSLPVEETFFRMARHREFDVAEMSLSSYLVSKFLPDDPFVAIPVFPSRAFRHSN